MAERPIITPEICRQLCRYEPDTGKLFWLPRDPIWFKPTKRTPEWCCNNWNSRCAGKEAFTLLAPTGYMTGCLLHATELAHKIAWAIQTGEMPSDMIDHEDGNRANNRFANLREAGPTEQARNMKLFSTNTSGHAGVNWSKKEEKWIAKIGLDYKSIRIGCFDDFDEAVRARCAAELEYGFHPNHGRR